MTTNAEPTTKQQQILDQVVARDVERPSFGPSLAEDIEARLHHELREVEGATPPGDRLVISKYDLQNVFLCEGLYRAELYAPFAWNLRNVRGKVAHRGIERLIISGYKHTPLDLVEQAVDAYAQDEASPDLAAFLNGLSDADREDLVGEASDLVTKFAIDWPEIPRRWLPRVESRVRYPLFNGRIELVGRVDFALGQPRGQEARVFVSDLKSGREHGHHIQDVRFYALVETLVRRVPPFRIGIYYLDSGRHVVEDVTADALESQIRRVVEGIKRISRIQRSPGDAELTPNPLCDYCPAFADCTVGQQFASDRLHMS